MEPDDALSRMREIQRIMERTTLCTLLPGSPSIIGGALAVVGCIVNFAVLGSLDFAQNAALPPRQQVALVAMWVGIAGVAVIQAIVLMARLARRLGFDPLARPMRLALLSLTPTLVVAAVVTVKLLLDVDYLTVVRAAIRGEALAFTWQPGRGLEYIVPVWMMCYGLGIYSAGLFSVRAPRVLAWAFVFAGALGLLFLADCGLLLIALSFGLFHIVFGLVVIFKLQRGAPA